MAPRICLGRPRAVVACPAALLLALALASGPAFADPLAVIAAVKGMVEVTPARGGLPQKAVFGRALERGDRVAVATGA